MSLPCLSAFASVEPINKGGIEEKSQPILGLFCLWIMPQPACNRQNKLTLKLTQKLSSQEEEGHRGLTPTFNEKNTWQMGKHVRK